VLRSHFLAGFWGSVFLNGLCDWSFEHIILGWGVFDLEAHLLGEVGARVALSDPIFNLIANNFFLS
jgi:hypothetical protein